MIAFLIEQDIFRLEVSVDCAQQMCGFYTF